MSAVVPGENGDLTNLENNNLSRGDKPTKKRKKKSKRHRKSDPLVTNISNLLFSSLNLTTPEKDVINDEQIVGEKINHDNDNKDNEDEVVNSKKSPKICAEINNENSPYLKEESLINDNINEGDGSESNTKSQSKNAFEFMMESRHKSIGRNSPGKEIEKETSTPSREIKDKLNARKVLMQKWAIDKESKKRKVEEKDREIYIKYHLERRAKKMKKMLAIEEPIKIHKKAKKLISDSEDSQDTQISKIQDDSEKTKSDNLIIDLKEGNDKNDTCIKINKSNLHQNDLRKFLTVTPKLESEKRKLSESDEFEPDEKENSNKEKLIKIKMFSSKIFKRAKKTKDGHSTESEKKIDRVEGLEKIGRKHMKKLKNKDIKRKISMENGDDECDTLEIQEKSNCMKRCESSKNTRRKPSKNSTANTLDEDCSNDSIYLKKNVENDKDNFPRRSLRSRKVTTNCYSSLVTYMIDSDSENDEKSNSRKDVVKIEKNVKLAPIFLKTKSKLNVDPLVLEARRNFLLSGIPDALKKVVEKQQSYSVDDIEVNFFPKISHVLQKSISENGTDYWNLPKVDIHTVNLNIPLPEIKPLQKGSLNKYDDEEEQRGPLYSPQKIKNLRALLLEMKKNNPDYPVFRSFRLLKEKGNGYKSEDPSKNLSKKNRKSRKKKSKTDIIEAQHNGEFAMWTEKYKANTYIDIIGNYNSTLKLRKWLQGWLDASENKSKIISRRNSSGSEFDYDGESCDSDLYPGNTIVVNGPHGSGKTMTIYALCNELGINVIELNASSKRTGKRLMQKLQEATQSHRVRKNEAVDLNAFITKSTKKREQLVNNSMSLLLVEDVDIVFEQDEGFLTSLTQLISTSKRPIILVTTDISSSNLQKIISQNPVVKFSPLSSKTISVWLQILCSLEGCFVNKESLDELLELNEGDVRKTLLQLQFWIQNGGGNPSDLVVFKEEPIDDQFQLYNDALPVEEVQGSVPIPKHSNCLLNFSDRTHISLEKLWWNLPQFTGVSPFTRQNNSRVKIEEIRDRKGEGKPGFSKLLQYFEAISEIDKTHTKSGIATSNLSVKNALFTLKDSTELCEVYDDFNGRKDFIKEWTDTLISGHICKTTEVILDMGLPNLEEKRWQNKQKACKREYMKMVSLSCHTDKRAFTLDYFPCLRTITRSEETRSANSHKRKNRFYNYFRNWEFHCSDLVSRTACGILYRNVSDIEKTA